MSESAELLLNFICTQLAQVLFNIRAGRRCCGARFVLCPSTELIKCLKEEDFRARFCF